MKIRDQIKKMTVLDIGILKVSMIFFGFWIAKIWPAALLSHQWVYLLVWLGGSVYLLVRLR